MTTSELSELFGILSVLMPKIESNPHHLLSPKAQSIFSIEELVDMEYNVYRAYFKAIENGEIIPKEYLVSINELSSYTSCEVIRRKSYYNATCTCERVLTVKVNSHVFNVIYLTDDGKVKEVMYHPTSEEIMIIKGINLGRPPIIKIPNYKDYDDVDAYMFQLSTVKDFSTEEENIMKFFMFLQKFKSSRKRLPKFSTNIELISLSKLLELYD